MSQFPIETQDIQGLADGVNYLLSGPGGLGQNFAGFSSSDPAYITGNFRKPYTQPSVANLYVSTIALNRAEMLDERTFKYTFTSAQAAPPFSLGNGLSISGFTDNIYNTYPNSNPNRNSTLGQIGVVQCTTTYVIVRSIVAVTVHAPEISAGSVFYYSTADLGPGGDPINDANFIGTDCDVRVTVSGGTDRVFISGQMTLDLTYAVTGATELYVVVEIDRYFGFLNNDPNNPDFLFNFDRTVAYKLYTYNVTAGTGSIPTIETIFSTILDEPDPGFYRYFINLGLASDASVIANAQFTVGQVGLRDLSAQVVKQ
jgi:hypothetical protein